MKLLISINIICLKCVISKQNHAAVSKVISCNTIFPKKCFIIREFSGPRNFEYDIWYHNTH